MTVLPRRAGGGRTAGGQGVVRLPRPSKACRSCPGGPLFLPFHFEIIIDSHDKFQKQYREVLCPHYSAFPSGGISRSTRTLTERTGAIQLTGFYLNLPQMSLYTCLLQLTHTGLTVWPIVGPRRGKAQNATLGTPVRCLRWSAQGHCKGHGLWSRTEPGFKPQLCNFLGGWPCAHYPLIIFSSAGPTLPSFLPSHYLARVRYAHY